MTNAEYITNKGWKFRDLFAQFSQEEWKWNIYHGSYDGKIDNIHTPEFKDFFHACDVVLAWLDMPHYEKPILDDAEKRYLKGVIRPWRNETKTICRYRATDRSFIMIKLKDGESVSLPLFETGTMYKGMEENKAYTLEELRL